jgi:hypothetical protein
MMMLAYCINATEQGWGLPGAKEISSNTKGGTKSEWNSVEVTVA